MRSDRILAGAATTHRYPVVGNPQVSCTPRTLTTRPNDGSVIMSAATACQTSSGEYPACPRLPGICGVSSAATIRLSANPAAFSAARRVTNQARWSGVPWKYSFQPPT